MQIVCNFHNNTHIFKKIIYLRSSSIQKVANARLPACDLTLKPACDLTLKLACNLTLKQNKELEKLGKERNSNSKTFDFVSYVTQNLRMLQNGGNGDSLKERRVTRSSTAEACQAHKAQGFSINTIKQEIDDRQAKLKAELEQLESTKEQVLKQEEAQTIRAQSRFNLPDPKNNKKR